MYVLSSFLSYQSHISIITLITKVVSCDRPLIPNSTPAVIVITNIEPADHDVHIEPADRR